MSEPMSFVGVLAEHEDWGYNPETNQHECDCGHALYDTHQNAQHRLHLDSVLREHVRAAVEEPLAKADEALLRWEQRGSTSLTVALCVEALYDLRAALAGDSSHSGTGGKA